MKRRKPTNKNVPAKGRLREIADELWAKAVKSDWAWKCGVCKQAASESHHIIPRQHEAFRFSLKNGIALCYHHHQSCADMSPHLNAAGWLMWLEEEHPTVFEWYMGTVERGEHKSFSGTKNWRYYCQIIVAFREYFEPEEFEEIVGIRFSAWLAEEYSDGTG